MGPLLCACHPTMSPLVGEREEGGHIHAGLTVLHGMGKSLAVNF